MRSAAYFFFVTKNKDNEILCIKSDIIKIKCRRESY